MEEIARKKYRKLPVVSLSAEYLTMGYLLRRNIVTYKAPPNNEGYDLLCIHPDPKISEKVLRVQVKSRYQTDCDRAFPVKEKSFNAFEYLVVVFLNIGYFYGKKDVVPGIRAPEFYTFPNSFIRQHHIVEAVWQKVKTKNLDIEQYKNEKGFELIAKDLGVEYPQK